MLGVPVTGRRETIIHVKTLTTAVPVHGIVLRFVFSSPPRGAFDVLEIIARRTQVRSMVLPVTLQNSSGTHAGIGNIMRPQVSTDPGRSRAKPNTVTIDRASDLRWSGSDVLTRHRATIPEHDKKAERGNLRLGSQPDQRATPAARSTRTACDDLRFVTRQSLSRTM